MNWYIATFCGLCFLCAAVLCFGMWDEIKRTGRSLAKAAKRYWRIQRGDVLTAGLLLTVLRVTLLKHGGWLSATALLAMACGMAA